MNWRTLLYRSLTHYWRTNLAVTLGVGVAVAVLSGALLVGESVRASLRDLVLQRLGKTDHAVITTTFFRDALSSEMLQDPEFRSSFTGITPLIVARGFVRVQGGEGRAGNVAVYGVDDRFWSFHGVTGPTVSGDEALLSPALATELGQAQADATLLIRMQRPTDMPLESLHSRKDDASRTVRATVKGVLPPEALGEFSLQAQQGEVRAVFLPLSLLQEELEIRDQVNTLLISGTRDAKELQPILRRLATPEDLGLQFRVIDNSSVAIESRSGVLDDVIEKAMMEVAGDIGTAAQPILTYLANGMTVGSREVPYSLVTAMPTIASPASGMPPILLNDWTARDLNAKPGDTLKMEYYVWQEPGQLITRSTEFRVQSIVPMNYGDKDLAPRYPGITDAAGIRDWDPPFPIDLRRIRPIDEDYWERYNTTPKVFIPLAVGQSLWRSRYGSITSIRFPANSGDAEALRQTIEDRVRAKLDPLAAGIAVVGVRSQSLEASRGATNFGEYFVYFSFFLVISALLLAALFFKLSVEQRVREIGLLRAVGMNSSGLTRLFLTEGLILSIAGAVVGVAGAAVYAWAILWALSNWWVDAVGTRALSLHPSAAALLGGAVGGVSAAAVCVWLTLRGLRGVSDRTLLAGELGDDSQIGGKAFRRKPVVALVFATLAAALLGAGAAGLVNSDGAFFATGFLLLTAALSYQHWRLGRPHGSTIHGSGWRPVSAMALRNAAYRPARSVTAMTAIAAASFILISVDAFRKDSPVASPGGYSLIVETLAPIAYDPNSAEGRRTLNLGGLQDVHFEPFRLRPGDDASCLNLYEPKNPQILAPRDSFIQANRFTFQNSLASSDQEQRNPWVLLNKTFDDGAIPVIADANSLTYVLHRKLGDDFVIPQGDQEVRLRFVGALSDSIFQGSLLVSEANFLKLFPGQEGYSVLLAETPQLDMQVIAEEIEDSLTDYGADVTFAAARLAEFHRVENTYLSTFQMLGGLGLLLGTAGLAAILLRSVLERRRELALLRVLGYSENHLFFMTVLESASLLLKGLAIGTVSALIAIAPAAIERGGPPVLRLTPLFAAILALGLLVAAIATKAALRGPVLSSLRSE